MGDFLIKFACGGRFVKKILPEAGDFLKKIHLRRAIFERFSPAAGDLKSPAAGNF